MRRKHTSLETQPVTGPTTTVQLRHQGRLSRIAGQLANGATVTEIAEHEGISRVRASALANSPECRQLIAEFISSEEDQMRNLFYRALGVIEHAFSAEREYLTKDGQVLHGGPDHYARLAASKHFRDFLTAGRPPAKHPEIQDGMLTLEQIQQVLENVEFEEDLKQEKQLAA